MCVLARSSGVNRSCRWVVIVKTFWKDEDSERGRFVALARRKLGTRSFRRAHAASSKEREREERTAEVMPIYDRCLDMYLDKYVCSL